MALTAIEARMALRYYEEIERYKKILTAFDASSLVDLTVTLDGNGFLKDAKSFTVTDATIGQIRAIVQNELDYRVAWLRDIGFSPDPI